ncbi:hypothetical protein COBT_004205, partial [Conglomerata obtusa]
ANESHWIAYPNSVDIAVDRAEAYNKDVRIHKKFQKDGKYKTFKRSDKYNGKKLFCALHGLGGHKTEDCSAIKKMESNGYIVKKVNEIRILDEEIVKEEVSENENKD